MEVYQYCRFPYNSSGSEVYSTVSLTYLISSTATNILPYFVCVASRAGRPGYHVTMVQVSQPVLVIAYILFVLLVGLVHTCGAGHWAPPGHQLCHRQRCTG